MSQNLRATLKKIIESGYQLSADGLDYLRTLKEDKLENLVIHAIKTAGVDSYERYILDKPFFQELLAEVEEKNRISRSLDNISSRKKIKRPMASEYGSQLEILKEDSQETQGNLESFIDYFSSRYRQIEGILRERIDVKDAVTIDRALKMPLGSKIKIIGMVSRKRTRASRIFIELEDAEDSITVMASDEEIVRKGLMTMVDQVICVDALKYRKDLFIAKDVIWPDIPSRNVRRAETPLCAVFLSDLHIGSMHFDYELFNNFVRWVNMEVGPAESRRLAGRIKYVVIAGDLVDGIGVYPDQIKELEIRNIREQYEAAASLLSDLPNYIEIIIAPGNHDAVRKSLPQPPISKENAGSLHIDERVNMIGNPCRLLLEGVEVLLCHGKALDDILSQTPGMDFHSPVKGMELLLKSRHLSPIYGATTPLAPEKKDRLVITSTPDIFHMGHIHVYNSKKYKGVTMIASSTWQKQTSFQKRMNLIPTPGIAPIIDLHTHQVLPLDFNMIS